MEVRQIVDRYQRVKTRYAGRDTRMAQILAIREGRMSEVAPDLFPVSGPWQEPIVANMIDVAARDLAEQIAPLPAFNCTGPTMTSDRAKSQASLKTKIALGYVTQSELQVQMYTAADWYVTYGFLPGRVEIDFETNMPHIRLLNPMGSYPEMDRFGRVVGFFQRVLADREVLANQYPEFAGKLLRNNGASTQVEVLLHHDKDADTAVCLAAGEEFVLDRSPNIVGRVMVRVAQRPGPTDVPRGQFDDVMFVQLAKSRMALLALQAAHDSVNAPLIVPSDVANVPLGPGSTIRTNNPQGVRRAALELPPAAFAEQAQLERELQLGSRYPQVRGGETQGSTVTGKGVQALMSGFDSQVRTHQAIFSRFLQDLVSASFEVDEKVFGNVEKTLRGTSNGSPYEIKYRPTKAIKGDHTVDVRYGLMAGLDPNRWLVFALQARAEKMFSRDFMRREMPVEIDVEEESRKIDVEDLEESAKQALMGYAQAIPALAAQGQDPSGPLRALAQVIDARRKGQSLADAVVEAMMPEPEPEPEISPESSLEQLAAQAGGGMPPEAGMGGPGGPPEEMRGMPMEQMPDMASMLASFTGRGEAQLSANVKRNRAV